MNLKPPKPASTLESFFVKQGSTVHGPLTQGDLVDLIAQGSISPKALWSSNQLLWAPLATLPGLEESRNPSAPSSAVRPSSPIPAANARPTSPPLTAFSPLQVALIIAVGGTLALTLTLVLLLAFGGRNGEGSNPGKSAHAVAKKLEGNQKAGEDSPPQPSKGPRERNQPKERKEFKEPANPLAVEDRRNAQDPGQAAARDPQEAHNENARLNPEQIFERLAPSVAQIQTEKSTGSGFLVRDRLLVTNHHVLRGKKMGEKVAIQFHSAKGEESKRKIGIIKKMIPGLDLAFVAVPTNLPALELADWDQIRPGRQIVAIGSPGLGDGRAVVPNTICQGIMGQLLKVEGIQMLQLSIAVNPGNSGGPAIDPFGKVVGVVTAKGIQVEAIAFCVPAHQIKDELEKLNQGAKE